MKNTDATVWQEMSEREKEHLKIVRKIAAQGMVLLENHDCLPLTGTPGKVALFGNGARRTVKGGTGSGDVNVRFYVTVEQGLENAGFEVVTKKWLDDYDQLIAQEQAKYSEKIKDIKDPLQAFLYMTKNPFVEPGAKPLEAKDLEDYKADVAIYVIARNSGEGADRMVREGDYLLSKQEIHDLTILAAAYKKLVVLLNVGGVIDTKPLREIPGIGAILLMSQAGSAGGDAVVDVLTGKVTPSGKLTTTWAESYSDYPSSNEFSHMSGSLDDSYYKEGIYVGYRYFDTFNIMPSYPFGYGKSYTDFSIDVLDVTVDGDEVTVKVKVTNIGNRYSGKEVVQVYYSAPEGELEKPYQELAAFRKTKELAPGESEILDLHYRISSMASYSEKKAAYVLEPGEYYIRVGNSSRNTHVAAVLTLSEEVITEQCRNLFGNPEIQEISRKGRSSYTYEGEEQEIKAAKRIPIDKSKIPTKTNTYRNEFPLLTSGGKVEKLTVQDVKSGKATLEELVSQLTVEEMAELCVGCARAGNDHVSILGNAAERVPGASGETTSALMAERDIRNIVLADGPAGLRLVPEYYRKDGKVIPKKRGFDAVSVLVSGTSAPEADLTGAEVYRQYCTALPVATLLAQTWDESLIREAGDLVGREMLEMGVTLWLAPGMNIHRNPLCGRNFEYYSEDPLVSGICAAAITEGVQKHPGVGTTIKHLAANNQENNRFHNNSIVRERTLREIYLKGFEICVKQAQPMAIMSSYNLINGIHTANCYDLLTAAVRDEWGFQGLIMTDWGTTGYMGGTSLGQGKDKKYGYSDSAGCIKAGNDLIMPGSKADVDRIVETVKNPSCNPEFPLTLEELQWCSLNILRVILQSSRYEDAKPYSAAAKKRYIW